VKTKGRQHFTRLPLTRSVRSTPGSSWQFARPQTSRLDRERVAAVGTLGTRGYTQPADQVQSETSNRRLEGGQGGENRARHHERGYPLESLAAEQNRVNYRFDKVQLRIYDTDKLAADNLRRTSPRATTNWSMRRPPSPATCQPTRCCYGADTR